MNQRGTLPPAARVASTDGHGRRTASAAARNAPAIVQMLRDVAPSKGRALEIASGTGQHIVQLATALPGLSWQPSDVDPARLTSIAAWAADALLPNLRPACQLDATKAGWAEEHASQDVILLVNLLHLIGDTATQVLISESAKALAPGGIVILYGPFMRSGVLTSAGDRAFHESLREADPDMGYKDDTIVLNKLRAAGLTPTDRVEMPANNLTIIAQKI